MFCPVRSCSCKSGQILIEAALNRKHDAYGVANRRKIKGSLISFGEQISESTLNSYKNIFKFNLSSIFMEKKGVSGVITTVLLILIVLAAIGIIWVVISGFLSSSTEQIDLGVGFAQLDIIDDSIRYISDDSIELKVKRDSNPGNITGLRVIIEDENGNSKSYDIDTEIKELETKTFNVPLQNEIQNITKISIAPRTPVKNKIKTGMISDELYIKNHIITDDGLVGHWTLDGNAKDFSGNNHDGTVYGNPIIVDGKYGRAYSFDGTNDYINIPCSAGDDLNLRGDMTISAWINSESTGGLSRTIYSDGYYYDFSRSNSFIVYHNGHIQVYAKSIGSDEYAAYSEKNVLGDWNHVTFVLENNQITVYINGILDNSDPLTIPNKIINDNVVCNIGRFHWSEGLELYYFSGIIDEVRIYNRSLTSNEAYYLYRYN